MSFKVTFHRTYEISEEDVLERLPEGDYISKQDLVDMKKETAEEIARERISDEMELFSNNTEEFVSATIEEYYE